jgi:hypothetical protein
MPLGKNAAGCGIRELCFVHRTSTSVVAYVRAFSWFFSCLGPFDSFLTHGHVHVSSLACSAFTCAGTPGALWYPIDPIAPITSTIGAAAPYPPTSTFPTSSSSSSSGQGTTPNRGTLAHPRAGDRTFLGARDKGPSGFSCSSSNILARKIRHLESSSRSRENRVLSVVLTEE